MPLKFMHLLDPCMLEVYRNKILLERSFQSQKTADIGIFLLKCRKTDLNLCFLRYFETRTERWKKDIFAAIRNMFEKFNNNCGKSIILGDLLSIDKTLYPMRSKVEFKQFKPNKPAMYGLLFKSINVSCYPQPFVSAPYCGRPVGERTEEYKPGTFEVTKHMVSKLESYTTLKGRNISFDRLYTSLSLMNYLLEKYIRTVGTLVSNRKGLPKKFVKTTGRKEFSYEILWNADDV